MGVGSAEYSDESAQNRNFPRAENLLMLINSSEEKRATAGQRKPEQ